MYIKELGGLVAAESMFVECDGEDHSHRGWATPHRLITAHSHCGHSIKKFTRNDKLAGEELVAFDLVEYVALQNAGNSPFELVLWRLRL